MADLQSAGASSSALEEIILSENEKRIFEHLKNKLNNLCDELEIRLKLSEPEEKKETYINEAKEKAILYLKEKGFDVSEIDIKIKPKDILIEEEIIRLSLEGLSKETAESFVESLKKAISKLTDGENDNFKTGYFLGNKNAWIEVVDQSYICEQTKQSIKEYIRYDIEEKEYYLELELKNIPVSVARPDGTIQRKFEEVKREQAEQEVQRSCSNSPQNISSLPSTPPPSTHADSILKRSIERF